MGWSDRDERKGNGEHGRKTNRYPDEILIATKDVVRKALPRGSEEELKR